MFPSAALLTRSADLSRDCHFRSNGVIERLGILSLGLGTPAIDFPGVNYRDSYFNNPRQR